jgi:aspartate kinase
MTATKAGTKLAVIKIGGSVLTGLHAFESAASFLDKESLDTESAVGHWTMVAVVSAEFGHTDALAREARVLTRSPDPAALDLLWSTGELRSVALLTLALKNAGVAAAGLNAHEAGLRSAATPDSVFLNDITLRAALARHRVVVVPGFLATRHQRLVTLGRGGSDLSAVLLAASLRADRCVLIKDVDGYFTDDPATNPHAKPIASLTFTAALAMADAGCPLVQRSALIAAERAGVPLSVRSFTSTGTVVDDQISDAAANSPAAEQRQDVVGGLQPAAESR